MKQRAVRQRVRFALLLGSALLFPITMNYLSPYVIIDGASQGIINGSFITFGAMFLSALFVGRLWCAWACPAGGFSEISFSISNRPVNGRKLDRVKWIVWGIWLLAITATAAAAGGYHSVNPLLDTQNGISVAGSPDRPILYAYIIYYGVIAIFLSFSIIAGRRAGCHTICWMAPFMILGRMLRNQFNWPALQLKADPRQCKDCQTCTTNCPMSLDVHSLVKSGKMENSECILCGSCIDGCSKKAIRYSFNRIPQL